MLTPLTGRDKWQRGCDVIPVYRNCRPVDGWQAGRGQAVVGAEAPLKDVACEHFVSGVPSTEMGQRPWESLQKCNREKWRWADSDRYGSCRSAIGEVEGVNGQDFYPESSRSLGSLRQMRLLALLHDMVDDGGKVKAARALGVNYRTLSRAVESGTLTERMSDALERHLLLGGGSAAAQQRELVEAQVERLAALEEELQGGLTTVAGEVKALREEHARAMRHVERRLVGLESEGKRVEIPSPAGREPEPSRRRYIPSRTYPQLVTEDAEPDEDQVYGEATPVIVEWRKVRDEYRRLLKSGQSLDRTEVQGRKLELEIGIIGEHELTLPPVSYPWDWAERRDQVWERRQGLKRVRVERIWVLLRLWLRRILTCGLWRK